MLPAFRVKGLYPKQTGPVKTESNHPVTGVRLPKFDATESILQLPKNKYDDLIKGNPEYRLKYLDEDKEEITIGSELELTQKLDEKTSHSRLVKLSEDPKFYTSIPECLHSFHVGDSEEARRIWTFFKTATIARNLTAHKLWTSPRTESPEDVQTLLNQHAHEFMTGYDFDGFVSHYNHFSEAGQKIKEICAQKISSQAAIPNEAKEGAAIADFKIENFHKQQALHMKAREKPSTSMEEVREVTASIHKRLDEQLASAKALTRSLDNSPRPSTSQYVTFAQLDEQLKSAQLATAALTEAPTQGTISSNSSKEIINTEHLTDAGKQAAQEAGVKLRRQLYGTPKTHAGASKDEVHRWLASSRDPPSPATTISYSETNKDLTKPQTIVEDQAQVQKKKTVRFSLSSAPRGTFNLDGSYSPGTSHASISQVEDPANQAGKGRSLPSGGESDLSDKQAVSSTPAEHISISELRLSKDEVIKVQQLLKTMDELPYRTIKSEVGYAYRKNLRKVGIVLEEPAGSSRALQSSSAKDIQPTNETVATREIELAAEAKASDTKKNTKLEANAKSQADTPETMVTKLWCQTFEGIIDHIQNFSVQLDGALFPQIKQATIRATNQYCEKGSIRSPEGFHGSESKKDLDTLRSSMESLRDQLKAWTDYNKNLLSREDMFSDQSIDIPRIRRSFESLVKLKDEIEIPFSTVYKTFSPSSGGKITDAYDAWDASYRLSPETHWMPRRYASDVVQSRAAVQSDLDWSALSKSKKEETSARETKDGQLPSFQQDFRGVHSNNEEDVETPYGNPQANRFTLDHFPALIPSRPQLTNDYPAFENEPVSKNQFLQPTLGFQPDKSSTSHGPTQLWSIPQNNPSVHEFSNLWNPYAGLNRLPWSANNLLPPSHHDNSQPGLKKSFNQPTTPYISGFDHYAPCPNPVFEREALYGACQRSLDAYQRDHIDNQPDLAAPAPFVYDSSTEYINQFAGRQAREYYDSLNPVLPPMQSQDAIGQVQSGFTQSFSSSTPALGMADPAVDLTSFVPPTVTQSESSMRAQPRSSFPVSEVSNADVPESVEFQPPEPFQDIPEHSNPRTATRIRRCVETLKDLGYGSSQRGGDARLVVYAQAARGDVNRAVDIISEEQQVYQQHENEIDELYN